MARPKEELHLIAELKEAIRDSGLSLNEIARQTGVSDPQLSRFMRGERSLTLGSAAKLFDFFELKVQRPPRRTADGGGAAPPPRRGKK